MSDVKNIFCDDCCGVNALLPALYYFTDSSLTSLSTFLWSSSLKTILIQHYFHSLYSLQWKLVLILVPLKTALYCGHYVQFIEYRSIVVIIGIVSHVSRIVLNSQLYFYRITI